MFKSATSYLWGSSSSSTQTTEESKSDNNNTKPSHHQNTASLTDLDELDELEFMNNNNNNEYHINSKSRHSVTSQSIAQIPYHSEINNNKEPPIEIILDKESKYKLSATAAISFLFNNSNKNTHNRSLYRYPYYIASNRNARYLHKMDLRIKELESKSFEDEQEEQEEIKERDDLCIINVTDLNKYLDSLNLTNDEKKGILTLCEWVKTEKLSIKLCSEMLMSEIIITYFSSLSPTNPDLFGCWKKWIIYRSDHGYDHSLYNVNCNKLKQFFDSGIFSIGFDNERRPVWFINTEFYDDSFGSDIITKACILWVSSLLWNLKKNEFDLFALRRGLSVYVNLSHWSINMVSWSILQSVKKAMVAYPFHLVSIYISNIPTFMYLLKQLAAKVVVPHAMEKLIILPDTNDYFEKYAEKHKTPKCAGGTLKVSATQWIKDRGFLDYINEEKSIIK